MKYKNIKDYHYIGSSLGNAYFSGMTFDQLWSCIVLSENREQLDEAVNSTIKLNELVEDNGNE